MNTCVYCSSRENLSPEYCEIARRVGREIGAAGDTLVFGGIRRGLMRIVAESAQSAGARVVGVIPQSKRALAEEKDCHLNDENIFTDGIGARKTAMIAMSTRFIVLPGGFGTLDELFTTITEIVFGGLKDREILIYNHAGLYDDTIAQIDKMKAEGLIGEGLLPFRVID